MQYFYPRSPCGERRCRRCNGQSISGISIHALLAESDPVNIAANLIVLSISIHALLAESDLDTLGAPNTANTFLSTLSLRRATLQRQGLKQSQSHFYPRSPCGERQKPCRATASSHHISIHALLAESDLVALICCLKSEFLSTLSLRRATPTLHDILKLFAISIHALLAESDSGFLKTSHRNEYFYPRSPCGERHVSTFPCFHTVYISIHALLAESDIND